MKKPLVSVIMATYNEPPRLVQTAISSILNQTYSNFELLIFDDSTKKETIEKIDEIAKDSRTRLFRFDERKGFVASLNEGLEKSKGDFIARMDGDDYSLPDRLEKQVNYLLRYPKVSVVGGQMDIMDINDNVVSHRSYPLNGIKLWLFSCFRNPLGHPSIMMRKSLIEAGYRYDEQLSLSEDLDLWLRLINDGHIIENLPDTLVKFRVLDNFTDKRLSNKQRKYMYKVRYSNFRISNPLHGIISVVAGFIFKTIPVNFIRALYNKENKK